MLRKKILVTGGAGFIGSHSVDLLLQENYQVTVLDNLSSGKLTNLPLDNIELEFIEGDILEYPLVEELVAQCDAVLHLAAIPSVALSLEAPIYCFQVNMQGFLHVLAAIQKQNRPIALIYASSAAVYGEAKTLPCQDDTTLLAEPISPYALQKRNNEDYARLYFNLFGTRNIGLRYFNVYGDRQDPASPYSGVISIFADGLMQDKPLTIYGDGLQTRDFIHVSDVAKANCLAIEKCLANAIEGAATMNIATGKEQTLLQLISYLEAALDKQARVQHAPPRDSDIKRSYGSVERARTLLNFTASIDLAEGVKKLTYVA